MEKVTDEQIAQTLLSNLKLQITNKDQVCSIEYGGYKCKMFDMIICVCHSNYHYFLTVELNKKDISLKCERATMKKIHTYLHDVQNTAGEFHDKAREELIKELHLV